MYTPSTPLVPPEQPRRRYTVAQVSVSGVDRVGFLLSTSLYFQWRWYSVEASFHFQRPNYLYCSTIYLIKTWQATWCTWNTRPSKIVVLSQRMDFRHTPNEFSAVALCSTMDPMSSHFRRTMLLAVAESTPTRHTVIILRSINISIRPTCVMRNSERFFGACRRHRLDWIGNHSID